MIAIDGYPLILPPGGIKSFLYGLLKHVYEEYTDEEIVLLIPSFSRTPTVFDFEPVRLLEQHTGNKTFSIRYCPIPQWIADSIVRLFNNRGDKVRRYLLFLWSHLILPHHVRRLKPRVVLHPYQVVADYKTSAKKVVVIHDIFHWEYLDRYTPMEKFFYGTFRTGCARCDTIITISQSSKKEIMKYLGVPEKKIVVCYEGLDDDFISFRYDPTSSKRVKTAYNLPEKYLFGFVSVRNYKNSIGNVRVFHELKKLMGDTAPQLVLVGGTIDMNDQVKKYIQDNHLRKDVFFIPTVHHIEDLHYIYHHSYVTLFLSYEEGFGIPPLEALSCYSMPIVSNVSSIGELFSDYLPSFPPDDASSIAAFIAGLSPAQKEKKMKEARKLLLKKYSWKEILPNYLRVLSS